MSLVKTGHVRGGYTDSLCDGDSDGLRWRTSQGPDPRQQRPQLPPPPPDHALAACRLRVTLGRKPESS